MKTAVIFGGSGFIGSHFTQYLLDNEIVDSVVVADLFPLVAEKTTSSYSKYVRRDIVKHVSCDVRNEIELEFDGDVVLVANFAAVHREPGHEDGEYYTTNLLGAATVCRWTATINCNNLIFTSSIAPYGLSENLRDESSIPVPASAYGGSKLAAEKIHEIWQAENRLERRLVIVRPGVVFGAGENGNVTRLIKATIGRYFLYMANRDTRKAGTYVKELCNAMYWVLTSKTGQSAVIFNMGMDPSPTIKDYVEVVSEVGSVKRFVPNIPYWFVYPVSFVIDFIAKLTGVNQPINPVRIRKLVRSNNIVPQYLRNNSYEYLYTFRDAMQDWKGDKPADWEQ